MKTENLLTTSTIMGAACFCGASSSAREQPYLQLGANYRMTDKYVYFEDGFLGTSFLVDMTVGDDFVYRCCQQFILIEKALLFDDKPAVQQLRAFMNKDPHLQSEIGMAICGAADEKWTQRRFDIAFRGNMAKFTQHKQLREKLLSYPHAVEFVNAHAKDTIWGIGVALSDKQLTDSNCWIGQNLLGKALTKVRNCLIPSFESMTPQNRSWFIVSAYVRLNAQADFGLVVPQDVVRLLWLNVPRNDLNAIFIFGS